MQRASQPWLSPRAASVSWRAALAALAILLLGGGLRLYDIGRPFATGDHAEVAAIATYFYPRGVESLVPGAPGSFWNVLQNPHGIAPMAIALPWISAVGLLGVPITELWWNLPFALFGLLVIPLGYRLGEQLGGREAGWVCALLMAALPVHATLSRASGGGSHIAIALVAQLWAVAAAQRYFEDPSPPHMRRASLAIVCAVLTDVLLPLLFFLLLAVGVFSVRVEGGLWARLREARRMLFGARVIIWPLVALAWPVGLLVLRGAGVIGYGGLLERLFLGSDRQAGVRVFAFVDNAALNVGPAALAIIAVCALAAIPGLLRFERRGFLLVWAGLYLGPFVLFSRPYVFDFYVLGMAPLVVNAALVLAGWLRGGAGARRVAAGGASALLALLLALRSATMIGGGDLGPIVGTGQAAGAIFPDQGLKAAAWWVRDQAPADALVFADAGLEPYQMAYYLRGPFLALTDPRGPEEVFALLDGGRRPDYYIIRPESEGMLRARAGDGPQHRATVLVEGRPALLIYGPPGAGPAQAIDADRGNRAFDRQFGGWGEMFGR